MTHYLVKVKNETPLIINYSTGNYYRSLDYIPATSILGALKAKKLSEKGIWGGERREVDIKLSLTDAYPSEVSQNQLNIPSLVTLYKINEEDDYYVDAVKAILNTIEGKEKWGRNIIRLKKGPRHWYMKGNKAYPISLRTISTNILKLDDYLKTAYQVKVNGEKTGYLAHIESIYPGQIFAFEVLGEEEEIEFLIESLKEGIFVGSFKTKGYGLIKLVDYQEVKREQKNSEYYVLDFYGSVSYDYYAKLLPKVKVIFESIGIERRKVLDYDMWRTEYIIKPGSVMVVKSDENLYQLEKDSIISNKGGKIVVNHPIHGL